jgi:glycosyltransferase involved in cell wall biosynthesis
MHANDVSPEPPVAGVKSTRREPSELAFSIVVPTYNRAHLIERTLVSLLAQREPSFEIVVVDDGGNDNTEAVIGRIADSRVSYHWKTNGERGAARNYGTARSRGAYLNYFDSDDLAHPNHLAEARALIDLRDRPAAFHLRSDMRTVDGRIILRSRPLANRATGQITPEILLRGNALRTGGVFLRRDVALAYPFEEDQAASGSEDWILWLRIIARFPMFENDALTSTVVQHEGRSVVTATLEQLEDRTRLTRAYLERDDAFVRRFGVSGLNTVDAHMHTYTALHAAMAGCRLAPVLRHLSAAVRRDPRELLRHRTLATLKHLWLRRMSADNGS